MSKHHALAVLAVCLSLVAPSAMAAAKPKKCLSAQEIRAEQEVRHGVFLREAARRCDDNYTQGLSQMWSKFDQAFGTRLAKSNSVRAKVYQREFPKTWTQLLTHADGRMVTYHRYYPLSYAYCSNVEVLLKKLGKKGYGEFSAQAEIAQNEVLEEYKTCIK